MNGREKMRVINWLADMGEVGSVSIGPAFKTDYEVFY